MAWPPLALSNISHVLSIAFLIALLQVQRAAAAPGPPRLKRGGRCIMFAPIDTLG